MAKVVIPFFAGSDCSTRIEAGHAFSTGDFTNALKVQAMLSLQSQQLRPFVFRHSKAQAIIIAA